MIGQAICGLTLLTVGIVEGDKDLLSRNPMFNNEVTAMAALQSCTKNGTLLTHPIN